jgi:hypothetical protein
MVFVNSRPGKKTGGGQKRYALYGPVGKKTTVRKPKIIQLIAY